MFPYAVNKTNVIVCLEMFLYLFIYVVMVVLMSSITLGGRLRYLLV